MKPLLIQKKEIVKEFKEVSERCQNPAGLDETQLIAALKRRQELMSKMFMDDIINQEAYQHLVMSDDYTDYPDTLR